MTANRWVRKMSQSWVGVMVAKRCEYTNKNPHWIIHFKMVIFMARELYLNYKKAKCSSLITTPPEP